MYIKVKKKIKSSDFLNLGQYLDNYICKNMNFLSKFTNISYLLVKYSQIYISKS